MEFRDPIIKSVVEKFVSRSNTGFKKYGVTLQDDNSPLDVWLTHLQEELMDAVNYIEKLKQASKEAFEERVIQEAKQQYEDQWKPEDDGYMLDNDEIWQ
jgi:trans-aconitate methyltransferase